MAGVAKWLRPRIVVPVCGGSSPLVCPIFFYYRLNLAQIRSRCLSIGLTTFRGEDIPIFRNQDTILVMTFNANAVFAALFIFVYAHF